MVYVFCVNDGAVMTAWKKDQGLGGSDMIEFLADTDADLTMALGLELTGNGKPYGKGDGPNKALGFHTRRCKRSAMCVRAAASGAACARPRAKLRARGRAPHPTSEPDPTPPHLQPAHLDAERVWRLGHAGHCGLRAAGVAVGFQCRIDGLWVGWVGWVGACTWLTAVCVCGMCVRCMRAMCACVCACLQVRGRRCGQGAPDRRGGGRSRRRRPPRGLVH